MSSSDPGNLFATQRWAADQRMIGTQAQVGAMQQIGNTAQDTVRYLQELSMRKQELDFKAQAFQVEQAIANEKLRQMQAIDMTTQSRHATEAMRLQNQLMETQIKDARMQVDEKERGYGSLSPQQKSMAAYAEMLEKSGVLKGLLTGAFVYGEDGVPRTPKNREEALEHVRKLSGAGAARFGAPTATASMNNERQQLNILRDMETDKAARIQKEIKGLDFSTDDEETIAAKRKTLEAELVEANKTLDAIGTRLKADLGIGAAQSQQPQQLDLSPLWEYMGK